MRASLRLAAALCIVGAVARAVDQEPILESKIVLGQVVGRIDHSGFDPVRKASVPIATSRRRREETAPAQAAVSRDPEARSLSAALRPRRRDFSRIGDRDACRGPPFSDGPAHRRRRRAGVGHPEAIRQFSSKC